MILRDFKWNGYLLANFPGLLVGTWLGSPFLLRFFYIGISKLELGRDVFTVSCG